MNAAAIAAVHDSARESLGGANQKKTDAIDSAGLNVPILEKNLVASMHQATQHVFAIHQSQKRKNPARSLAAGEILRL
jgi:hypothetical protein